MIAKVLRIIASGMPRTGIVVLVTRIKMQDWLHLLLVAHVTVAIHCRHRAQRDLQQNFQHALQRNSQLGNQHECEWVILRWGMVSWIAVSSQCVNRFPTHACWCNHLPAFESFVFVKSLKLLLLRTIWFISHVAYCMRLVCELFWKLNSGIWIWMRLTVQDTRLV